MVGKELDFFNDTYIYVEVSQESVRKAFRDSLRLVNRNLDLPILSYSVVQRRLFAASYGKNFTPLLLEKVSG